MDPTPAFTAEAGDLLAAIDRVKHAMAADLSRPILASFLIEATADADIRLVAADNYRLALVTLETADIEGEWPQTVVARDGVPMLRDFLTMIGGGANIRVERLTDRLRVTSQMQTAEVRLVDGTYPDHAVITDREGGPVLARFNPKYLADAGKAAGKAALVTVKSTGPLDPVLVTDGNGYREWIMPVKVAGQS